MTTRENVIGWSVVIVIAAVVIAIALKISNEQKSAEQVEKENIWQEVVKSRSALGCVIIETSTVSNRTYPSRAIFKCGNSIEKWRS